MSERDLASQLNDAERSRTQLLVVEVSTAAAVLCLLYLGWVLVSANFRFFEFASTAGFGVAMLGLRAAAQRGHGTEVSALLVLIYLGVDVFIATRVGLGTLQSVNLVVCILLGGFLLGRLGAIAVTLVSSAIVFAFWLAARSGWRPPHPESAVINAMTLVFILGLVGLIIWRYVGAYRQTIVRVVRLTSDLDDREVQLADLVRQAPDGMLSVGTDGVLESINPAIVQLAGYPEEALVGKRFWDLPMLDGVTVTDLRSQFAALLSGAPIAGKVSVRHADGRMLHLEAHPRLVRRVDGTLAVHATVRDLTGVVEAERRQKALQDRLNAERRLDSLGQLAGGMAHDFNNMLTVMTASAEGLADRPELGHDEDLKDLRAAIARSTELTRQLLAFGRRRPRGQQQSLDVGAGLVNLKPMLQRLVPENISLTIAADEALWPVSVDPSELDQILVNLVSNAAAAQREGGAIHVRAANVEKEGVAGVVLSIEDRGPGVPADQLDRIFEPFFTTKEEGTGLGLATVHGIVQQSGGSITVTNVPGGGARFEVLLPRAAALAARPAAAAASTETTGARVLLIEDQDVVLRSVARALAVLGHHPTSITSPEEALTRFSAGERWDLVLSDVVMPGMSGPRLVKQLRAAGWSAPVLLMSGYPDRAEPGELGDPVLAKPFTRETLATAVSRALAGTAGR